MRKFFKPIMLRDGEAIPLPPGCCEFPEGKACERMRNMTGTDCWFIVLFQLAQVLFFLHDEPAHDEQAHDEKTNCLIARMIEAYEEADGQQHDLMDALRPLIHELPNYYMKFADCEIPLRDTTLPYLFVECQDYATRAYGTSYSPNKIQGYKEVFHILHKGINGASGHWLALRLSEGKWYILDDQREKEPVGNEPTWGTLIFSVYVHKNTDTSYAPHLQLREVKNLTESSPSSEDQSDSWEGFTDMVRGVLGLLPPGLQNVLPR